MQHHFWTFVAGVVCCAAWLIASITNVFAAKAISPPVRSMFSAMVAPHFSMGEQGLFKPNDAAFVDRNLFNAEREVVVPRPVAEEETSSELAVAMDTGDCHPDRCRSSKMSVELVATVWCSEASEGSMAMFQMPNEGYEGLLEALQVGDELQGKATVTAVFRNTVCVSRAGDCEIFILGAGRDRPDEEPRFKVPESEDPESEDPEPEDPEFEELEAARMSLVHRSPE